MTSITDVELAAEAPVPSFSRPTTASVRCGSKPRPRPDFPNFGHTRETVSDPRRFQLGLQYDF